MKGNYYFGIDWEFMLMKDGKISFKDPGIGWKGEVGRDGIAHEFRSVVYSCAEQMHNDLHQLRQDFENDGYKMIYQDLVEVPNIEDFTEEERELGCAPQRNAYRLHGDLHAMSELPLRSTGTHFHFSASLNGGSELKDLTIKEIRKIIRAFDKTIGLLDIALFPVTARRQYYGMLGSYRKKPYGFEYRSPSGLVGMNPELCAFYARFMRGVMYNGIIDDIDKTIKNEDIIDVSLSGDREKAADLGRTVLKTVLDPHCPHYAHIYEDLLKTDFYTVDRFKKLNHDRESNDGIESMDIPYHHYPRRSHAPAQRDVPLHPQGGHPPGQEIERRA